MIEIEQHLDIRYIHIHLSGKVTFNELVAVVNLLNFIMLRTGMALTKRELLRIQDHEKFFIALQEEYKEIFYDYVVMRRRDGLSDVEMAREIFDLSVKKSRNLAIKHIATTNSIEYFLSAAQILAIYGLQEHSFAKDCLMFTLEKLRYMIQKNSAGNLNTLENKHPLKSPEDITPLTTEQLKILSKFKEVKIIKRGNDYSIDLKR